MDINLKKHATAVYNAALRCEREADEKYEDDDEMRAMLRDDAHQLRAVSALVLTGNLAGAYELARGLDSAVRDRIPRRTFAVLQNS